MSSFFTVKRKLPAYLQSLQKVTSDFQEVWQAWLSLRASSIGVIFQAEYFSTTEVFSAIEMIANQMRKEHMTTSWHVPSLEKSPPSEVEYFSRVIRDFFQQSPRAFFELVDRELYQPGYPLFQTWIETPTNCSEGQGLMERMFGSRK